MGVNRKKVGGEKCWGEDRQWTVWCKRGCGKVLIGNGILAGG